MVWFPLAIRSAFFVTSCIGLGYFAGYFVRRHKWPGWALGLMVLAVAVLWPVIVVLYTIYDANRYLSQHPHDDAPGMLVVSMVDVGAPILFVVSLVLTSFGVGIHDVRRIQAERRKSKKK